MSSLSDRIAAALAASPSSGELANLIAEASRASTALGIDRQRAEREALDPRLSEASVERARGEMERAAFAVKRLETAVAALQEAKSKAEAREAEARRREVYAEALAARDAAATALRERYPALAGDLAALLRQVVDADRLVTGANGNRPADAPYLETVEEQVRGLRPNGEHPTGMVGRLSQTVFLPALDIPGGAMTPMVWNGRLVQ